MIILKDSNMPSFIEFGSIAVFCFVQAFSKSLEVKSCLHE